MIVHGGSALQGYSVGILKFEGKRYPLPPGDIANPTTYPFPVLIREIPGVSTNPSPPVVLKDGQLCEQTQKCIAAAQQLETDGVHSIAMCCGFFSLIQEKVAASVRIPVLTSSLIMLPVIHQMLPPDQSVVVVTASEALLTDPYFSAIRSDRADRIVVAGLDNAAAFNSICMGGTSTSVDLNALRQEVLDAIVSARNANPDIGAVLLECTTLPPFAVDIRAEIGIPVFDFVACIEWMHRAIIPKRYEGYM